MRRAAGIAAAGALLVVVARLFDAVPLYVCGVAFVLIGVLVPAWTWLASRGANVERRLGVRRVEEGQAFEFELVVRGGRVPVLGGAVLEPLLAAPVPLGSGRRTSARRVTASYPRRGLRRVHPPSLLITDPLDIAPRTRPGRGAVDELLVLPRTEPIRFTATGEGGPSVAASLGLAQESRVAPAEVDMDGLRPYRPGSPAARIHWPALARGAGLLERRLRAESDARPLVVLDARGAERPEDLDAAVRAAASLTLDLSRHGGCALLLPGERRATVLDGGPGPWAAAHARLALVDGGPGVGPPLLAGAGVRQGPTFYVAARRLTRLPASADGVARATRVLVVPGQLDGRSARFEVAGCSGYVLRAGPAGARRAASRAPAPAPSASAGPPPSANAGPPPSAGTAR